MCMALLPIPLSLCLCIHSSFSFSLSLFPSSLFHSVCLSLPSFFLYICLYRPDSRLLGLRQPGQLSSSPLESGIGMRGGWLLSSPPPSTSLPSQQGGTGGWEQQVVRLPCACHVHTEGSSTDCLFTASRKRGRERETQSDRQTDGGEKGVRGVQIRGRPALLSSPLLLTSAVYS